MSKIWIITHNAPPPEQDVRVRNKAMAKYLTRLGHDVTIFGASTIHNTDINLIHGKELYIERIYEGIKFVHVKAPSYCGNGLSRIKNLMVYPFNLWRATKHFAKPDIIINDLEVFALNFPFMIANRYKIPIITEVRDLVPESLIEYGYVRRNSFLAHLLYWLEKRIYIKSDKIVFSMEGGKDYLQDRKLNDLISDDKIDFINNGVDLEVFEYNKEHYRIEDDDLSNDSFFKIVYTGSIRRVNNLGLLLDSAKHVKNRNVKILIWGTGDELQKLQLRVENEKIHNVVFKGRVSKEYIPYIVSKANVNIAHNNPSSIFKYGISFNKLFDYLAAGKPIICDFSCPYNPAVKVGAAIEISDPLVENIGKMIDYISSLDYTEYLKMCNNAAEGAHQYDYAKLSKIMDRIIREVVTKN